MRRWSRVACSGRVASVSARALVGWRLLSSGPWRAFSVLCGCRVASASRCASGGSGPNYTKFCGILSNFVPEKFDKIQILCNSGPFVSWSCCRGVCVRPASLAVAPWALRPLWIDLSTVAGRILATCQGYENYRRDGNFLDRFAATLTERIPGGASSPPTDSETPTFSAPRRVSIIPPGSGSGLP